MTSGKNIKLGYKDMFVQLVAGSSKPPLVTTLALNKIFAPSKTRGNEYVVIAMMVMVIMMTMVIVMVMMS